MLKKKIRISEDRLYLPANLGGLGIFDIKKFLKAQHCSWILHAFKLTIDSWRFDLALASPDCNILQIKSRDLNANSNPILKYLAESYEDVYSSFSRLNGNFKEAYVFEGAA